MYKLLNWPLKGCYDANNNLTALQCVMASRFGVNFSGKRATYVFEFLMQNCYCFTDWIHILLN